MPRLAVNMMVLNGAAVLRRCLMPLRGVVDELVVADTGSTDDTQAVLAEIAADLKLERYRYERLHPCSPAFFTDEEDSFQIKLPGPFTGCRLPKDWASVRNSVLDETTADYVLKLDADDEPVSPPENWLRTCDLLDTKETLDLVSCPYEICDGRGNVTWLSMYDRLWRRVSGRRGYGKHGPGLRWVQPCHEMLSGKDVNNVVYAAQGLRVRDHRDSPGAGVRVAHRNLKVLLWNYENGESRQYHGAGRTGYSTAHAHLVETFTLAHEAAEVLPEFALELLAFVMKKLGDSDPLMLADCHYHAARALETRGDQVAAGKLEGTSVLDEARYYSEAEMSYRMADATAPHLQALLKLHSMLVRLGFEESARELRPKILSRVGDPLGPVPVPFNCDLGLLAEVRALGAK